MQGVSVFLRGEKFFSQCLSYSLAGTMFFTEPCIVLLTSCTDDELGRSIEVALQESRQNMRIPHSESRSSPLLDASGVKSWSVFMRGAQQVRVERVGQVLKFTPSINKGKLGFVDVLAEISEFAPTSKHELGARVRNLLTQTLA